MDDEKGQSALMRLSIQREFSVMGALIMAMRALDAKDKAGFTALILSAIHERERALSTLLNVGCDVTAVRMNGMTDRVCAFGTGKKA